MLGERKLFLSWATPSAGTRVCVCVLPPLPAKRLEQEDGRKMSLSPARVLENPLGMAPPSVVVVGLCYRLASLLPPLPSFRSREGGSLTPGS